MNVRVTIFTPGYIRTNISQNALTKDGTPLGTTSENIEKGLPAEKAAAQMLRGIQRGVYEDYVGKGDGEERLALLVNRWAPSFLIRRAGKHPPK